MAKRAAASPQPRRRRTRATADDTPASAAQMSAAPVEPTEDEIRTRAYHRFLERGSAPGNDFDDWLEAERELKTGPRG